METIKKLDKDTLEVTEEIVDTQTSTTNREKILRTISQCEAKITKMKLWLVELDK